MRITTRYTGATAAKGARVIATHTDEFDGSVKTVSMAYKYELNADENHIVVAKKLLKKLTDATEIYKGDATKSGKGYRFFDTYNGGDWGEELELCI